LADERDEIRRRIAIEDLVGREIPLRKAGKNFQGLCPFHPDKTPSFSVSPDTGRFKCWACGEAGDIFTWVMKRQNVDFMQAMRILAKEAGVTLSNRDSVPPSQREAQHGAMAHALAFFREQLGKNPTARDYCEGRGLDAATLDAWEIGYAPDVREMLAISLRKAGFNLADCKELFLVDGDQSTGYVGKFYARLMFPIRDERGELVAFGGRVLGQEMPKYINSSDTPLYRKSRVLYGMNRAREKILAERRAVLVEGYLDVIACHRAGVTNAVASLGTSLSEEHAKLLKRWCDEVVILYDSDNAGQKAATRAVGVLSAEGLRVRVALMPPGDDPDTLLRKSGPEAVRRSVEGGLSPLEYGLQSLNRRLDPSQDEFWSEAVALLATAPTELELERFVVRLAPMYPGLRDSLQAQKQLRRWVNRERKHAARAEGEAPRVAIVRPKLSSSSLAAAEVVVYRAFLDERYRSYGWTHARNADLFATHTALSLSEAITAAFPDAPPAGPPVGWLHYLEPEELRQILSDLLLDVRGENINLEVLDDAVARLRRDAEKRAMAEIRQGEMDDRSRQEYLLKLRQRNPDRLIKNDPEDDRLF